MTFSKLRLMKLIFREVMSADELQRCPEPSSVMEDVENIESFHAQGADSGALIPVYHLNALGISALLPYGGTVVDIGCGSGQFLRYLANFRCDCNIIGFDLSERMVLLGNKMLKESNLNSVVRLEIGDMTRFSKQIYGKVDIVSSLFAFHHLPSFDALAHCLGEIKKVREQWGCGVWIFDHARPRLRETAQVFPELFTPEASGSFLYDSMKSLLASFSFSELTSQIDATAMGRFCHECSRILKLYQIHWLKPKSEKDEAGRAICSEKPRKTEDYRSFLLLKMLFKRLP